MNIIGVDPGASGGVSIMPDCSYDLVEAHKMPKTDRDLWELMAGLDPGIVFLEKVHSSPQMGVVSAFKFGDAFGSIRMACVAAGLRVELVTPMKWQRELGLIVKGRGLSDAKVDKKNRNKARAQELFPQLKITHATADAILLAEYGRRMHVAG